MLFLVSQTNRRSASVAQVARELNLIIKPHAGSPSLAEHLGARTRRIACLAVEELDAGCIEALAGTGNEHPLGLIVCGTREEFTGEDGTTRLAQIDNLENVTWVQGWEDVDELRHAARVCWQRMLRVTHAELRDAIANDELVIQYQPKVERYSGVEWRTREAESLLRWRHPERGPRTSR